MQISLIALPKASETSLLPLLLSLAVSIVTLGSGFAALEYLVLVVAAVINS